MINLKKIRIFSKINFYNHKNLKFFSKNKEQFSSGSTLLNDTLNIENEKNNIFSLREKLLKLSLLNVENYGWTEHSIKKAANELGYSNNLSSLLENGPIDLVYYTIDNWNNKLRKDIQLIKNNDQLDVDEKYKKALKLRLGYEIPVINTWPQAMKLGMSPHNINQTLQRLLISTDEICQIEESNSNLDKKVSTFKRWIILKLFILGELHLITDKSYNNKSTWDFIDKAYSINNTIEKAVGKFANVNGAVLSLIKYSLTSFAPYDFSKVDELLNLKVKLEKEKEKEDYIKNLNTKL